MSERILKALMQLFAIIANVEGGISSDRRNVVLLFLKLQLNQEQIDEYLRIFDEFVETHSALFKGKDSTEKKKRTSLNSVKVLKICTQINEELAQKQKVVVLIRLLEFVNIGDSISDQEMEFVTTVADTFNIDKEEFDRCLHFVQNKDVYEGPSGKILIVDNKQNTPHPSIKHIYSEFIEGELRVMFIASVNMYIFRYLGDGELYLNGQVIDPGRIYVLTNGSSIRSSKVNPIYYSDIVSTFLSDARKSKIVFAAEHIEYKFKGGKTGLHQLNLHEEGGKLVGIMGASGAGKSTLLNVLNGNESPTSGTVKINGTDIHVDKDQIQGVIGHISQDDLLIEELTVFQNLYYNAKLCFGNLNEAEIKKRVLDLLTNIGLYETRDLKVGSPLDKTISGGQRKRLNIALELIREPSVLFVDEPTSGLSSRDSENIMDLLKELSLKGKMIFVVIHQPSSDIFKMFDKLLILDTGGYPVYYGNPVDAVVYFKTRIHHVNSNESECGKCGNVNPEQIFNIIESKVLDEYGNLTLNRKVSPREWNEYYHERKASQATAPANDTSEIPKSIFSIPNKIKQYMVFITRDVLSKLTNKQYLAINLLEAPLLAFILAFLVRYYKTGVDSVGYVFRENENLPAYLFMAVVVALFMGLTVSAEEIIRDRKILKRESFLNLSRSSYLMSKVSIMFVLSAIQTLTFVIIGNTILEVHGLGMNLNYWCILFTTSCFANMLGLNISSSFNSAVTVYILIPFLLIPQLLLSGVIVKFDKLHPILTTQDKVPVAGEVMTSRWAFEALAVTQYKGNNFEHDFYGIDKIMSFADFRKNYWIPSLRAKIDKCIFNLEGKDSTASQDLNRDLALLHSEIDKELEINPHVAFEGVNGLAPDKFDASVASKTKQYLDALNKFYIKRYNKASQKKDKVISKMQASEDGRAEFIEAKNEYQNESLTDLVRKTNDMDKIIEWEGELVQRADPIYLDPLFNSGLRTHFFAPRKKLLGAYVDTFWVNLIVIWLMCLMLYITLYFDVLKKCMDYLGRLAGRLAGK
ncbi:MAG: ATP-binding cassette domain-containing protein [Flavobacteriales bacterium]|nr:ATP-binding cassette domain-containing protein [Flavobacteriales bacterium]MCB9448582.1 ATP-binding cassette domain-containing protein [Flavobacteriales bacterium]